MTTATIKTLTEAEEQWIAVRLRQCDAALRAMKPEVRLAEVRAYEAHLRMHEAFRASLDLNLTPAEAQARWEAADVAQREACILEQEAQEAREWASLEAVLLWVSLGD